MNIAATQYSLPTRSFEIYLSGCKPPYCEGCHNPELWDFEVGEPLDNKLIAILGRIQRDKSMISQIWILGGEPLGQPEHDLEFLLMALAPIGLPICLFTKYSIQEVPEDVLCLVDIVKTGRYDKNNPLSNFSEKGIPLTSVNQQVYQFGVDY